MSNATKTTTTEITFADYCAANHAEKLAMIATMDAQGANFIWKQETEQEQTVLSVLDQTPENKAGLMKVCGFASDGAILDAAEKHAELHRAATARLDEVC
jgi:hypothetical protein